MELFSTLADFILHIDGHLQVLASEYGLWLYGILFLIVFLETGLVVMPLLPGDSLLFAAGSLASIPMSQLSPHWLFVIFSVAAILGDTVNYSIGHALGPKVFSFKKSRFFNPDHLRQTHEFFEKYGGKTIIIARFVPIVRTFAPFVAGIGAMSYSRFIMYNVVGALLWVAVFTYSGYWFGQMSFFKDNLKLLILGIIVVSVLIPGIEYVKHRFRSRAGLNAD
ncbi:SNARE associated Golgi protein [Chlorobaculum parvum NCIB 8327]|uniref:SNARE associated Golgi protein n=1 Tax=Chlorobaculum parvum (strain DSM 263 / NCIMB 8327) TaxID=517417 RepID=B3QQQ4_CHLP8|nr:DedA family protein [Chlorobaculum parvum]ACF12257.1 SNARE associated Golgi protein [Chlorobaculum parvum NCIB 8327]